MKIEIIKCDICGEEQRSDLISTKYWADIHSDRVALDFRFVPSIQSDLSKEHLCKKCARELYLIILDGIEYIKEDKLI